MALQAKVKQRQADEEQEEKLGLPPVVSEEPVYE
jgi:hypothetical protein